MRAVGWLLVAATGFAAMLWSYLAWQRRDRDAPWATGLMVLGSSDEHFGNVPHPLDGIRARVRLLPPAPLAAEIVQALGTSGRGVEAALSEKLVEIDPEQAGIGPQQLKSGRLPVAGAGEVLAGFRATFKDRLKVQDSRFQVVGVLKRDVALFADSYLVPPDKSVGKLFQLPQPEARLAVLVRVPPDASRISGIREQIREAFPPDEFTWVASVVRVERGPYYLYLAGQALLLLGGSGFLIGLYRHLRQRVRWRVLRGPLRELARRRRLLWTVHLAYFGLVIVASLLIYEIAPVQMALLNVMGGQIQSGQGVLGTAGKAYASGVIPIAAAVTFGINFLFGSVAYITLPSLVVPASGALLAGFRAVLWGLALAPTFTRLSLAALPHSWTILLEGEGYILATFFALLVPIYLFRPQLGGLPSRYGRAVLVNLQGALVVAAVLLAAACYEATEVILMTR